MLLFYSYCMKHARVHIYHSLAYVHEYVPKMKVMNTHSSGYLELTAVVLQQSFGMISHSQHDI